MESVIHSRYNSKRWSSKVSRKVRAYRWKRITICILFKLYGDRRGQQYKTKPST